MIAQSELVWIVQAKRYPFQVYMPKLHRLRRVGACLSGEDVEENELSMTNIGSKPVLVVDDSFAVLMIVRSVLQRLGIDDVDEAQDGTGALQLLRSRHYGLVISDWNMVPMTGYELLRRVRADEVLKTLPFVMMTVDTDPDKMIAAKRAGVNSCLIKPFSAATLHEKIGEFLSPQ